MNSGLHFAPKKILVFRIGHLGDTLVALPAMWAVKRNFPDAHLTLLSNFSAENANYLTAKGVLPDEGLFDDWLSYPTQTGTLDRLASLSRLFFEIRKNKFDTLIYLMTGNRQPRQIARDLRFFRWAGIGQHAGTKYLLNNFLPEEVSAPLPVIEREHLFSLKCLTEEGIGLAPQAGDPNELLLTGEEKAYAQTWLNENCREALAENRLIAVAPGSKWNSKVWDEEKYTETLLRLITSKNLFPVIFGGPEDGDKAERILQKTGIGANAAGKLNVRQAAAALSHCLLYLGNDTGTMHLAAAVGVPCVAVFAAIDYPGRWYPYGEKNIILRKSVPCEGCHSPECKFNRECLDISVDRVYEACLKVLDSK